MKVRKVCWWWGGGGLFDYSVTPGPGPDLELDKIVSDKLYLQTLVLQSAGRSAGVPDGSLEEGNADDDDLGDSDGYKDDNDLRITMPLNSISAILIN